jgi:hypothetical protein
VRTLRCIVVVLFFAIAPAGCAARRPVAFEPAPRSDEEINRYNLPGCSGEAIASGSELVARPNAALWPICSHFEQARTRHKATYDTNNAR